MLQESDSDPGIKDPISSHVTGELAFVQGSTSCGRRGGLVDGEY